jgi:peptidoglycan/LPS O-acetylase OafA/YrhL
MNNETKDLAGWALTALGVLLATFPLVFWLQNPGATYIQALAAHLPEFIGGILLVWAGEYLKLRSED